MFPFSDALSSAKHSITRAEERIGSFLDTEITFWTLVKALLLVAAIVYGFEIFQFQFSVDEEIQVASLEAASAWVAQGRWMMYVLNRLFFPFTVLPVLPLAFGLIFYIFGTSLILRTFSKRLTPIDILVGCFAIIFPSLILIFTFTTIAYGVGAALFFVAAGFQVSQRSKTQGSKLLAAFCYCMAIGVYQSFLLLIVSLYLFKALVDTAVRSDERSFSVRDFNTHLKSMAITIVVALLLYVSVQKFLFAIMNLELQYVTGFFNPKYFFNDPVGVARASAAAASEWIYSVTNKTFLGHGEPFKVLIGFAYAVGIWIIIGSRNSKVRKLLLTVTLYLAVTSAFWLNLMNNGVMPYRTLVSLPFTVALTIFFAFRISSVKVKGLLFIVSIYVLFIFSVVDVRHQNSTHVALTADRALANRIIAQIEAVETAPNQFKKLALMGALPSKESNLIIKNETIGASFFEWEDGNPLRILAFMDDMGLHNLAPASTSEDINLLATAMPMPVWPLRGSVKAVGDIVIVKLSETTPGQKSRMCAESPNLTICPK